MKYFFVVITLILLISCSSDENVQVKPPVAVNDNATTSENTSVKIFILQNDELNNNAEVTNYDDTSINNGTIIKRPDKSFIYTPADKFSGTDTFTYTICDGFSTPNCSTATVTITVTDTGDPIAMDDSYEVIENASISISNLLANDTVVDGATLSTVDGSNSIGNVTLSDQTVTYTAPNGFAGTDTFTYTLCDTDGTPMCSTATVTITVLDEGSPAANDDSVIAIKNQTTIFNDLLDNDNLIDDANLTLIDDSNANGNLVINNDGTVSYQPATDFQGQASFTYTICDDDNPTQTCSTATVSILVTEAISFNIPQEISGYYSNVIFLTDMDYMYSELSDLTEDKHTTILTYVQRHNYLYDADEDLNNPDNVILMYSGESRYWEEYTSPSNSYMPQTFNTEHIYPQSLYAGGTGGDELDNIVQGDLHHLRVVDDGVNSQRLNYPYVEGSGTYGLVGGDGWYPGDEWKGDVARMIMYLNVRYGETFTKVGSIELFLQWNIEDPVSAFEQQRNNVIYSAQGNRNPFIDNPYLATLIWGGNAAQNTWQ